jgi:glycerol-3-phosphate dehydrogenase
MREGVVIDHQKTSGAPGLLSILGVKYTTARLVAEQAVDLAVGKLGMKAKKCQTYATPVKGGNIDDFEDLLREARREVAGAANEKFIEHLIYTYGSEYRNLVDCVLKQPDLARRIAPPLPVTAAEVEHAVDHEMALTLADVVGRRTELGSIGLPSMAALHKCASLIARELQWSPEHQQEEISSVVETYPFRPVEMIAT